VPAGIRDEIGGAVYELGVLGPWLPTAAVIALAAFTGLVARWLTGTRKEEQDRRRRWIGRGLRPLMISGAVAVGAIVYLQIKPPAPNYKFLPEAQTAALTPDQLEMIRHTRLTPWELNQLYVLQKTNWFPTLERAQHLITPDPSPLPVLLAGAGCLYLWWLATLLFDLSFVWHRYVRNSVTNRRLHQWNSLGLAAHPDYESTPEECTCQRPPDSTAKP
jgi:hypothetical protein